MSHENCSHHHSHPPGKSREPSSSLWIVLFLTTAYMIVEAVGGWLTGSLALFADSAHMAIDSAAIALALFSRWVSRKPANDRKTFGYFRAEILGALVNGSVLIVVAFGIFYEAWTRLAETHEVQGSLMTLIAVGGLSVNLVGAVLLHGYSRENINVRGVWLHLMGDVLGSVSAIIAGVLVWKFSMPLADTITSLLIGILILFGAWKLVSECVDVLLEAVPKGMNIADIRRAIGETAGVKGVHDLHLWTVTSGVPSLSVHITQQEGSDAKTILETTTRLLKDRFGIDHVTIQIEPKGFTHEESGEVCQLRP